MRPERFGIAATTGVCTILFAISPVGAQTGPKRPLGLESLLGAIRPHCERLVLQITQTREFALSLSARPVHAEAVCTCSDARFAADPRLSKFWGLPSDELGELFRSDPLKSYLASRMITSVLECLGPELDRSLQSAELPP